jgi:hypothetical protein
MFDEEVVMPRTLDRSLLEMALVGYGSQALQIEAAMATIRKELGVRPTGAATTLGARAAKRKHRMSAAGRRNIAAAQRRRWKAFHAAHNLAQARGAKAARASGPTA